MSTTCFGQYYVWPSSGWIQLSEKTTQYITWYSITISVGVSRGVLKVTAQQRGISAHFRDTVNFLNVC